MDTRCDILRNGSIAQIGAPHEVYSNPQSVFVASFVGGANFIEGNVTNVNDSGSFIEIRGDLQIRVSDNSKQVGEKVVVAVRPEHVSIGTAETDGSNNFPSRIKSSMFIGDFMEYDVELEKNVIVSSKILFSDIFEAYKIGERVIVSFLPERCYVFPYPKTGLLQEIEAI